MEAGGTMSMPKRTGKKTLRNQQEVMAGSRETYFESLVLIKERLELSMFLSVSSALLLAMDFLAQRSFWICFLWFFNLMPVREIGGS